VQIAGRIDRERRDLSPSQHDMLEPRGRPPGIQRQSPEPPVPIQTVSPRTASDRTASAGNPSIFENRSPSKR
jgi:hypothetical protein